jgi:hypothetical protein
LKGIDRKYVNVEKEDVGKDGKDEKEYIYGWLEDAVHVIDF